ncbi:hypothetical protein QVD17_26183 [Tagetes erecta]|uniref:Uncharacterized protein n=1 Tax=Tagetes erecta TaxID=13708 RepID=A0AAD8NQK4_TARER|nr:hypothetical protein QVD17_26183 [Tagetes erecta]
MDAAAATIDKAIDDDRTMENNPERLSLWEGAIVYSNSVVYELLTHIFWFIMKDYCFFFWYSISNLPKKTLCSGWLASALLTNHDNMVVAYWRNSFRKLCESTTVGIKQLPSTLMYTTQ